jgi:RimJ/RimL family protein N-acetyltransferase
VVHYQKLTGERCYLSPVCAEDAENWVRWLSDPEVSLPLGDEAYDNLSLERMQKDVQEMMQSGRPVFTIVESGRQRPIGRVMLFNMDAVNRNAMVGIFIGEKATGGKATARKPCA